MESSTQSDWTCGWKGAQGNAKRDKVAQKSNNGKEGEHMGGGRYKVVRLRNLKFKVRFGYFTLFC